MVSSPKAENIAQSRNAVALVSLELDLIDRVAQRGDLRIDLPLSQSPTPTLREEELP
jgi:hypothetical protein